MSIYTCTDKDCPIEHIEFTPRGSGNMAFITLSGIKDYEKIEEVFAASNSEQEIISKTRINGKSVLITSGPRSQDEIVATLGKHFTLHKEPPQKASIDPWAIRAVLGFTGQALVLSSTFLSKKFDHNVAIFAGSNILANTIAITFGGNDEEDIHRLKHVKAGMNNYFHDTGVHDVARVEGHDASDAIKEPVPLNGLEKTKKFISNYSAQLSIGLRYFGAMKLASNGFNAAEVLPLIGQGKFGQAARHASVKDPLLLAAGAGTLTGKSLALASNTVNPYDPKPPTTFEKMREKFFLTGGLIEAGAFSALAYQGFAKRKIKINGNEYRDFLRGSGSLMFVAAYLARSFASFEKHVTDMDEIYAHVADGLAHAPKEKLDQIVANTSAMVTEHFKDEHLHYGEVYTRIADDLYAYHGVALDSLSESSHLPAAMDPEELAAEKAQHPEGHEEKETILANADDKHQKAGGSFVGNMDHTPSADIYLDRIQSSPHAEQQIS